MEEIERQFLTEFDYKEEARLMRTAADNLAPTFGREVRVRCRSTRRTRRRRCPAGCARRRC